jgi:hypothetical protein
MVSSSDCPSGISRRLNILVGQRTAHDIQTMAQQDGLTATAVISRSIRHTAALYEALDRGEKVIIRDVNGEERELLLL